jgi:hypothetical protein
MDELTDRGHMWQARRISNISKCEVARPTVTAEKEQVFLEQRTAAGRYAVEMRDILEGESKSQIVEVHDTIG